MMAIVSATSSSVSHVRPASMGSQSSSSASQSPKTNSTSAADRLRLASGSVLLAAAASSTERDARYGSRW